MDRWLWRAVTLDPAIDYNILGQSVPLPHILRNVRMLKIGSHPLVRPMCGSEGRWDRVFWFLKKQQKTSKGGEGLPQIVASHGYQSILYGTNASSPTVRGLTLDLFLARTTTVVNLSHLKLEGMNLHSDLCAKVLTKAIDVTVLRTLELHDCINSAGLLSKLTKHLQTLLKPSALTSFRLRSLFFNVEEEEINPAVEGLLNVTDKLEEIVLDLYAAQDDCPELLANKECILRHRNSLKILIFSVESMTRVLEDLPAWIQLEDPCNIKGMLSWISDCSQLEQLALRLPGSLPPKDEEADGMVITVAPVDPFNILLSDCHTNETLENLRCLAQVLSAAPKLRILRIVNYFLHAFDRFGEASWELSGPIAQKSAELLFEFMEGYNSPLEVRFSITKHVESSAFRDGVPIHSR